MLTVSPGSGPKGPLSSPHVPLLFAGGAPRPATAHGICALHPPLQTVASGEAWAAKGGAHEARVPGGKVCTARHGNHSGLCWGCVLHQEMHQVRKQHQTRMCQMLSKHFLLSCLLFDCWPHEEGIQERAEAHLKHACVHVCVYIFCSFVRLIFIA